MTEGVLISIITGIVTILVAWLTTRNKASKTEVEVLRKDLESCKKQNEVEREDERRAREEIALQLKAALDEKNRLFDENLKLMQKIILRDTDPKIRKLKK